MNRSSTDFESVAFGLKPFITLTFIVCINVLYQCFFFKISKNIPMNVEHLFKILTEAQFVRALVCSTGCKEFKSPQPFRFILLRLCKMFRYFSGVACFGIKFYLSFTIANYSFVDPSSSRNCN